MDKKSKILVAIWVFCIVVSIIFVFWKYIIKKDYAVVIPDDPSTFVHGT